jgi:hypothetical protein
MAVADRAVFVRKRAVRVAAIRSAYSLSSMVPGGVFRAPSRDRPADLLTPFPIGLSGVTSCTEAVIQEA